MTRGSGKTLPVSGINILDPELMNGKMVELLNG